MTYGTVRRVAPKQPQGFEGLVDACRTAPELLEVMLTYNRGDVPTQDLLWGAAAAIALMGSQGNALNTSPLSDVVRSRHDMPFDRLVHACAVAGVQGWADPKQLLSGLRPERVHDSLQRELNRLPNSSLPREVMPGHRDALVRLGGEFNYSLHVPSRLNQRPATRLVAPLALGVVFSAFGQTLAVAETGAPTPGATTSPKEQNGQQRGSGFFAGFEESPQPASPVSTAEAAKSRSNQTNNNSAGGNNSGKQQPRAEITVVPERPIASPEATTPQPAASSAAPTPAETVPTYSPTPQATEVAPTEQSPSSPASQSPSPSGPPTETSQPAPETPDNPLPDPNAPVSGKVAEYPTSPQGAREFWKYASSLTGNKVGLGDTPPSAAGSVTKLTGSLVPISNDGSNAGMAEMLAQIPLVSAQLSGIDVQANNTTPQNPQKEVTARVVSDIKAMGAPELKGTFFSSIEKRASRQQNESDNNSSSSSLETYTNREIVLKAIENLGARGVEWKNRAEILKMFVEKGYSLANGYAFAGRPVIETGSVVVDPATKQLHDGPGRGPWQHGSFNEAYDRFGHFPKADGTYNQGTLMWFAQKTGGKWYELKTSTNFVFWELNNTYKRVGKLLKKAGDDVHKSTVAVLEFELPRSYLKGGSSRAATIKATYEQARDIEKAFNEEYQKLAGNPSAEGTSEVLPKEFTSELKKQIAESGRSKAEQALMAQTVANAVKMSDSYPYTVKQRSFLKGDSDFLKGIKKYGAVFKKGGFNLEAGNVFGAPQYDCKVFTDVVAWEIGDEGFGTDGNGNRLNTTGLFNQLVATGQTGGKYAVGIAMNPSMESLQPGDYLLTKGHIFIWTGPIEGKGGRIYHSIESARGSSRVPSFSNGKATYDWIKGQGERMKSGFMRIRYVQPDSVSN